jgi:hypothetical protein
MKNVILGLLLLVSVFLVGTVVKDMSNDDNRISEHQFYAAQCREQIGELATFSCADGAVVPITVNGETPHSYVPDMQCDRPALLPNGANSDGQCVPYSTIIDLSNDKMQAVAMCRQKNIRDSDSLYYDEVDVIAHNPATGATCWFSADGEDAEHPLDGKQVPSPTAATDASYWNSPSTVADAKCGNCHDNDPFMYSPFAGQVWENVPVNPLGPYYHVAPELGFKKWPTTMMNLRDNTCLGCHRIGIDNTCSELAEWMTGRKIAKGADKKASSFPLSHGMPPNHGLSEAAWNTIYAESVNNIRSCCDDNSQSMCQLSPIPAYHQK